MSIRTAAICALLAAACSRQQSTGNGAVTAANTEAAFPSPQQLANIKVQTIEVTPPTVRKGQPVDVKVSLSDVPPGTTLTLSWFGPNGWLAGDTVADPQRAGASFHTPASVFAEPGHYHAALRAGSVRLGDAAVDVAG